MSETPYDPEARRDTPLALKLRERIRRDGPIAVADYMRACLTDPEHGYYVARQAVGAKGDFVTAPEISQIFGELIGLWSAVVWQQMGAPARFNLVELGPGRGTMMRDALRAARIVPGFLDAASLHLIESNATLTQLQREAILPLAANACWHCDFASASEGDAAIPEGPTILLANEFLDCIPPVQSVKSRDGWRLRGVGLDAGGQLCFDVQTGSARRDDLDTRFPDAASGSVVEQAQCQFLAEWTARCASRAPTAGLFIDYGGMSDGLHDTLQAVRAHSFEHPLTAPGEADLTAQVNFADWQRAFETAGLGVDGPVTQAQFLGTLGIVERASRLMNANPRLAHLIETGVARLIAVPGMGDRFKAIAVRSSGLPPPPGFESKP
ncbi:MAG: class I SAM-dependent methyltransferase [Hyphomicrobiaceae bacterium]